MKLESQPSDSVTVEPRSDDADVTFSPTILTFTSATWNTPQTVTISAVKDDDANDDSATLSHVVSGYGDLTDGGAVSVTVEDNDPRGIVLSPKTLEIKEGESGIYTVKLESQPSDSVTVEPRSDDADVTFSPTILTFAPGNWSTDQTVTVSAAKDDDANDDPATLFHVVSGYGDLTDGGSVTVTVNDTTSEIEEEVRKVVTETVKAVAAATAANVAANIGTRFAAARSGGAVVVGGQSVSFGSARNLPLLPATDRDADPFADLGRRGEQTRDLTFTDLLQSSAFEIPLNAAEDGAPGGDGAPRWTAWGRGDFQSFASSPDRGSSYDGDLKAGYLGVEAWLGERWLAGVAGSRTRVEADYGLGESSPDKEGKLEMALTSVHPYLRFAPDERSELGIILSMGRGEIENERNGETAARDKSDVKMWMGSASGRRMLSPAGTLDLALLGDFGFARVETDDGTRVIDQLKVDAWRARAGVEVSRTTALESGAALMPFVEVAGRYDGGDGEDEVGLEFSGGMHLADPTSGFGLEARGRWLALHSAENYKEHGVSITASLSPRSDGLGLSLSVSPRWGAETEGADALWREDGGLGGLSAGSADAQALSLDARVGYGVRAMRGVLTPFGELGLQEEDRRRVRMGARFDLTRSDPGALSLELAGEWRERGARAASDHRVGLTGRLRF